MLKSLRIQFLFFLFLFIVIAGLYSNSLHNDFMMDDYGLILRDTHIHDIRNWKHQFIPDKDKVFQIENQTSESYYRPFAHLLPMLGWHFFADDPFGYHVMNLFLFYLCVMMVFFFVREVFSDVRWAFVTSFLYAIHPLNGLYINYITASVFGLQIIAMLGSFLFFWKASRGKWPFIYGICGLIFYGVSLLCHEVSLALPLYLTVSIIFLKKKFEKRYIFLLFPYFFLSIAFFFFRLYFASLHTSLFYKIQNADLTPIQFFASNIKIFFIYLSKFFYFEGILIKWTMPPVDVEAILWIFVFGLSLLLLGVWFAEKKYQKLWCGLILLIGFMPAFLGSAFELRYGLMFEPHWVFFPSIAGFLLISIYLIDFRKVYGKVLFWIFLVGFAVNAMLFTRHMNVVWGNEEAYCRYWLKYSPQQKGARFYLANTLREKGDYGEAKYMYEQSLEDGFFDWQIYTNLALMEQDAGNLMKAKSYHLKALGIFPQSTTIHNNLGVLTKLMYDREEAEQYFEQAIQFNPYVKEPYLNLGQMYEDTNDFLKALNIYQKASQIFQDDMRMHLSEFYQYIHLKKFKEAQNKADHILQQSEWGDVYLNVAVRLAQAGYKKKALEAFEKALRHDSSNILNYTEFGKYLANQAQWDAAIRMWEYGLKMDPDHEELKGLIQKAKQLQ